MGSTPTFESGNVVNQEDIYGIIDVEKIGFKTQDTMYTTYH